MIELDTIDRKILSVLQRDASLSQRDVADIVGLSQNACWRRIKHLTESGILKGSRARIDTQQVGLDLTVFMLVRTAHHTKKWSDDFRLIVEAIPEIIEFHRIGGEWDYLLKIVTKSMSGYDSVYKQLTSRVDLQTVTGLFAMETILTDRPLPL